MKILVCDDNVSDQMIMERYINKYSDACVTCIFTVAELISQIRNYPHRYDYMFIDQNLDTISGMDTINLMEDSINGTKIYIVSSYPDNYLKMNAHNLGLTKISGFLNKDNLEYSIKRILRSEAVGTGS